MFQRLLWCDFGGVDIASQLLRSTEALPFARVLVQLLTKEPASKVVAITDTFSVNEAFSCPLRKIRIPMASLEETHDPKRVEEDRSIAIEAAIVRVCSCTCVTRCCWVLALPQCPCLRIVACSWNRSEP